MTDLKQEARMLTLGERMILAAKLAVAEHLRQSVSPVPYPAVLTSGMPNRDVPMPCGREALHSSPHVSTKPTDLHVFAALAGVDFDAMDLAAFDRAGLDRMGLDRDNWDRGSL